MLSRPLLSARNRIATGHEKPPALCPTRANAGSTPISATTSLGASLLRLAPRMYCLRIQASSPPPFQSAGWYEVGVSASQWTQQRCCAPWQPTPAPYFNSPLCYWLGVWQTGPSDRHLAGQNAHGVPLWGQPSKGDTAPPGHRDAARWMRRTPAPKCHRPNRPAPSSQRLAAHRPPWREMAGAGSTPALRPAQVNGTHRCPAWLCRQMQSAQPYTASARLIKASTMELAMRSNTGPTTAASAADSKP